MNFLKRLLSSIILLPLFYIVIIKGSLVFIFFLIILFLISSYEWIKISQSNYQKFLGFIFLSFSFFTIFLFRVSDLNNNISYFLLVAIICISSDLGGYIFGNIFKGPKLTSISPNKTYAGVIGAYILSFIFSYFFSIFFLNLKNDIKVNVFFITTVMFISTISQIGDIIVSYFKRKAKIKDASNIIPGHGGLLDRLDGAIFAYPFSYFLILIFIR